MESKSGKAPKLLLSKLPNRLTDRFGDLRLRILSSLIMIPGALAVLWYGHPWFDLAVIGVCGLMANEWAKLVSRGQLGGSGILMILTIMTSLILMILSQPDFAYTLMIIGGILSYISARLDREVYSFWIGLGCFIIALPCLTIYWVYSSVPIEGRDLVFWLVGAVTITDVGAYFGGRLIGGPKLWPKISPNKTWAGLGVAILVTMVWSVGFAYYVNYFDMLRLVLAAIPLVIMAQSGDIFESFLKRKFSAKDSSQLIPGHGGVLDRLDGYLLTAPILAWLVWYTDGTIFGW